MKLVDGMHISCIIGGDSVDRALVGSHDGKIILFLNDARIRDIHHNNINESNGFRYYYRMNLSVMHKDLSNYAGYVSKIKLCNENPNYDLMN